MAQVGLGLVTQVRVGMVSVGMVLVGMVLVGIVRVGYGDLYPIQLTSFDFSTMKMSESRRSSVIHSRAAFLTL